MKTLPQQSDSVSSRTRNKTRLQQNMGIETMAPATPINRRREDKALLDEGDFWNTPNTITSMNTENEYGVLRIYIYLQLMTPFSMNRHAKIHLNKARRTSNGFAASNGKLPKINFLPLETDPALMIVFARIADPEDRMACMLVNKKWRYDVCLY
jgi:hypothetical protein